MKKEMCNKIEKFIDKYLSDYYYVVNYTKAQNPGQGYLWVFKNSSKKMIMVIHGGGDPVWDPIEVRLIQVDNHKTIDKQFENLDALYDYLKNDLKDDLMVYEI